MNKSRKEIAYRYCEVEGIEAYEKPKNNRITEIVEIIKETYNREPTNAEWDIIFTYPYDEILDQINFLNVTEDYYKEKEEEQKSTK